MCSFAPEKSQFKNGPAYFPLRFFGPAKTYTKHAKVQSALVNCNIAIETSACFRFRSTERTCNSALFSFKLKILACVNPYLLLGWMMCCAQSDQLHMLLQGSCFQLTFCGLCQVSIFAIEMNDLMYVVNFSHASGVRAFTRMKKDFKLWSNKTQHSSDTNGVDGWNQQNA